MKSLFLILSLLFPALQASGQTTGNEYFITTNGNLYIPAFNSQKGMYPILWYNKEARPKFLTGGFGVGFMAIKPMNSGFNLRGQANLSKHKYWDEPVVIKTNGNVPGGTLGSVTSDYSLGATAIAHFSVSERFSAGSGLGVQVLLASSSRTASFPETYYFRNRHHKTIMPVLPVALSYKTERNVFNIRYEQGLLNRFRGEVKEYRKDYSGILYFEVGFTLKEKPATGEIIP